MNDNLDNGKVGWKIKSGDKVTLPLGCGVVKIFMLGEPPMIIRVDGYYNAIRPDAAAEFAIGGTLQFLFPR